MIRNKIKSSFEEWGCTSQTYQSGLKPFKILQSSHEWNNYILGVEHLSNMELELHSRLQWLLQIYR